MTNNKTPDDATGDSVILARVHTFLAALLTFLGFGRVPDATVAGMLDELVGWLEMAKAIRRDPQGATARIWWEAWKFTLDEPSRSGVKFAAQIADDAVAEFGKRFLPVADDSRDTFDTADFEALRVECDRLDTNIALLESRADDLQQNLDAIISERDALLKANAHHASEIEALRAKTMDTLGSIDLAICQANGWPSDAVFNRIDAIGTLRDERDKLKASHSANLIEMAQLANALDAVRAVIRQKNLPDADVSAAVALVVAERDTAKQEAIEWESKAIAKAVECGTLQSERDELKRQLANATVPLPKPERVEAGQRWAIVFDEVDGDGDPWLGYRYLSAGDVLRAGTYLGKDA